MYSFFVDTNTYAEQFSKVESKFMKLLEAHGIDGNIYTALDSKELPDLIAGSNNKSSNTCVVVGGDELLADVCNAVVENSLNDAVLGFLPLDENNYFAMSLGAGSLSSSISHLARRRIIKKRLFLINNELFFRPILCTLNAQENTVYKEQITDTESSVYITTKHYQTSFPLQNILVQPSFSIDTPKIIISNDSSKKKWWQRSDQSEQVQLSTATSCTIDFPSETFAILPNKTLRSTRYKCGISRQKLSFISLTNAPDN